MNNRETWTTAGVEKMESLFDLHSIDELNTIDARLVRVLLEARKIYPFKVLQGHRGETEQNEAYEKGFSKLKFPHGKHNGKPSLAVDIAPDPYPDLKHEKEIRKFYFMASVIFTVSKNMNIGIRWGGDWDGDFEFRDNKFDDLFHFELVNES